MTVAFVLHRADGAPLLTSFRRAAFGKDDPFARHREIAWEGPDTMIAGRASFIGKLDVASFPHVETIVVVEGELTLEAAGMAPLVLGPQAGAVIGAGTALCVRAGSRARFVFCAAACEKPTKRGLIPLRADAVARLAGRGKRALAFGRRGRVVGQRIDDGVGHLCLLREDAERGDNDERDDERDTALDQGLSRGCGPSYDRPIESESKPLDR